jgi:hypothetical protein
MKNNHIVERINNEEFDSIEELKKRLFEYLKNFLNKKHEKEKEDKRNEIIFYTFIVFIIGYLIFSKFA